MKAVPCRWLPCPADVVPPAVASSQARHPGKPVRLIVTFPPGGGSDTLARIPGPKRAEVLGRQLVIDGRPGGGTGIGAKIAAKSLPGAHRVLKGNVSHAINVTPCGRLSCGLAGEFAPALLTASEPNILVAHPAVRAKSTGVCAD